MELNKAIKAPVVNVLSRGKVFVVFFEGHKEPILLPKVIAAEDGYVHASQFTGLTVDAIATQPSNGTQPGFLGTITLPLANMHNNSFLAARQVAANNYQMAKLYSVNAAAEN